mmetsp:Transcript_13061/g.40227  ORF Transcript_13061/g.40227 Transcript_13061/m.40227 type:complete len:346 (-) Transcript_13061:366-1403(-)|eukprot:CAMPEP_0198737708 /NCGR_PEP_ID=MMETSP1475-20131203/68004_1 /TAXON_ID= ORGANISM="Unidentified sp., Strain CCMP1999" /NCGR_SAMPLE_ID=MMETSP1475 /ASSEMBLY_ACC=CAM_ASM_001111 /LENGTH=345 /DNA_ID=CAMNT_0044501577 /DNA_START=877 /DNA_END=1914 /DNA_ORIENTATION=-
MSTNKDLVLITGGTGYMASHVIRQALDDGYAVRTTARDKNNKEKCRYLYQLIDEGKPLEIMNGDLLDDSEAWEPIVEGCKYILHVASPFYLDNDTEEELTKPATKGTLNVLQAAKADGNVKRLVLTSSVAAVRNRKDREWREESYTEDDFSELEHAGSAYAKSKTLSEKVAWDFIKENGGKDNAPFELAVINPFVVFGPPTHYVNSQSIDMVKSLIDGSQEETKDHHVGVIDVRDNAKGHLLVMSHPDVHMHRFILNSKIVHFNDIADILRRELEPYGYKIAKNSEVNEEFPADVSSDKIKQFLGMEFRSVEETIRDTAHALIKHGYIEATEKYKQGCRCTGECN